MRADSHKPDVHLLRKDPERLASLLSGDENCPGALQLTVVLGKKKKKKANTHMHGRGGLWCPVGSKPGGELRFGLAVLSK